MRQKERDSSAIDRDKARERDGASLKLRAVNYPANSAATHHIGRSKGGAPWRRGGAPAGGRVGNAATRVCGGTARLPGSRLTVLLGCWRSGSCPTAPCGRGEAFTSPRHEQASPCAAPARVRERRTTTRRGSLTQHRRLADSNFINKKNNSTRCEREIKGQRKGREGERGKLPTGVRLRRAEIQKTTRLASSLFAPQE